MRTERSFVFPTPETMYKPPENTNRVKSMTTFFENKTLQEMKPVTNNHKILSKSKTELEIKLPRKPVDLNLSRQLSDPSKRNIKRTPAFRLDKNPVCEKSANRVRYLGNKSQNLNCDSIGNTVSRRNLNANTVENVPRQKLDMSSIKDNKINNELATVTRTVLSSVSDNKINKSHVNQSQITTKQELDSTNVEKPKNLSFLYSEPIPKALRKKNGDNHVNKDLDSEEERFCNNRTLKLSEITKNETNESNSDHLTDTLKSALKKPLPPGPAPKKPPRTFEHSPEPTKSLKTSTLNKQFVNKLNESLKKSPVTKSRSDPKYMLDKLENALKNNKIRLKKQTRSEAVTSGEDSDDSSLKKSNRVLPNIPINTSNTLPNNFSSNNHQKFQFNCLNALGCSGSTYECIKQPNSSFFIDRKREEPLYAEPFQFEANTDDCKLKNAGFAGGNNNNRSFKNQRNSLYYMSSPILGPSMESPTEENAAEDKQVGACDTSSLSSDPDSHPLDAKKTKPRPAKIKDIIEVFELKNKQKQKMEKNGDAPDRIKELEVQLRRTIDKSFCCKHDNDDCCGDNSCSCGSATESNNEENNKDDITNKFETYVKTVRIYSQPGVKRDQHLFDCCLIVGLNKRTPYIKMKFPETVEIPAKIEELCFPDGIDGPMDRSDKAQCYSLVITNDKGKRTFGYCRRIIPEGSENCLPLAYCILSKHRAPRFYKRILKELESRHGMPDKLRDALLSEFYYRQFPRPGECLKIDLNKIKESSEIDSDNDKCGKCVGARCVHQIDVDDNRLKEGMLDLRSYVIVSNTGEYGTLKKCTSGRLNEVDGNKPCRGNSALIKVDSTPVKCPLRKSNSSPALDNDAEVVSSELILALHQDSRYEENGLKELHSILSTSILQKVFASLLLERKVILVSCVLSKLSSCIEALQSILYPFCWPHTLIPILPQSLWEIVEAPTPFVCGVLSVAVVNMYKIENAMVVDLDQGDVLLEVGDEDKILPSALVKTWKNGLSIARSVPVSDNAHEVLLSDAYLRVFIHSCGHYKQFINDGKLEREAFIDHIKRKGIRRFLTWFTETTMFYSFLDQIENDPSSYAIFDKRIQIYGSDESAIILDKMKDWKKERTLGSFFKFE